MSMIDVAESTFDNSKVTRYLDPVDDGLLLSLLGLRFGIATLWTSRM